MLCKPPWPNKMRVDRIITVHLSYPLLRRASPRNGRSVAILMYHSVSNRQDSGISPYYQINTAPAVFANQMKFLYKTGYRVINLCDIEEYYGSSESANSKAVIITFDDGYRDFLTDAFPVLQQYGFSATVFLPTKFIRNHRRQFKGKDCLTWDEVRELHANGVQFGSHTVTHPQLNSMRRADVEMELMRSKQGIEAGIGEKIDCFSYPYAFPEEDRSFVADLADMIERCEYKFGVSTRIGTSDKYDNRFFMKRIPINSHDDAPLLKAKIAGAYDWLYTIQHFSKHVKRKIAAAYSSIRSFSR